MLPTRYLHSQVTWQSSGSMENGNESGNVSISLASISLGKANREYEQECRCRCDVRRSRKKAIRFGLVPPPPPPEWVVNILWQASITMVPYSVYITAGDLLSSKISWMDSISSCWQIGEVKWFCCCLNGTEAEWTNCNVLSYHLLYRGTWFDIITRKLPEHLIINLFHATKFDKLSN